MTTNPATRPFGVVAGSKGVSGKSADGLGDDHVDVPGHALVDHVVELVTRFGIGAGDVVINELIMPM